MNETFYFSPETNKYCTLTFIEIVRYNLAYYIYFYPIYIPLGAGAIFYSMHCSEIDHSI